MNPRFRLQSILWFTLVVGILLAWWDDHRRLTAKRSFVVYLAVNEWMEIWNPSIVVADFEGDACKLAVVDDRIRIIATKPGTTEFDFTQRESHHLSRIGIEIRP